MGIDVGVARLPTLSDATCIAPPYSFKKREQRLTKSRRRMARKIKARRIEKTKAKIQRIHARIAYARNDFLHKASTTISRNHTLIDLQMRHLVKLARSTLKVSGRHVGAESGLNRPILDLSDASPARSSSARRHANAACPLPWRRGIRVAHVRAAKCLDGKPQDASAICLRRARI